MIGDIPKRAPLRCRLGSHVGMESGGTLTFNCTRCGGTYWQPKDLSATTARADALIAQDRSAEAMETAQREIREAYGK